MNHINEETYNDVLEKYIKKLGGKDVPVAEIVKDLRRMDDDKR